MTGENETRLAARAAELLSRARNGEVTYTAFLTPGEQKKLAVALAYARGEWLFAGGYAMAERQRMFFLPDYLLGYAEAMGEDVQLPDETVVETLTAVHISGSGYRTLTHRDVLGAVLHLGIERDAVGDVCMLTPYEAVLFCDRIIAVFLTENLTRVANDAVRVTDFAPPADFDGGRKFRLRTDTVAFPRADAVVAALCNLSRADAQALFRQRSVELDYEPEDKPDRTVKEGAVLTVRGHGKFIVRSLSEHTKKGRVRLIADEYV